MFNFILSLLVSVFSVSALANENSRFICTGQGTDFTLSKVNIEKVDITKSQIRLNYQLEIDGSYFTTIYTTELFLEPTDSTTNTGKEAFLIKGFQPNTSNNANTISLPNFGEHKDGLGGNITFFHLGTQIQGTVTCYSR